MSSFLRGLFGGGGDEPPEEPLDLPFEAVVVPGKQALAEREKLRARAGVTPVVMGAREDLDLLLEMLQEPGDSPQQVLELARAVDVDAWLAARRAENGGYEQEPEGEWPKGKPAQGELGAHLDVLTRRPKKRVVIGLIPTAHAWEAPAWVRYGGWNDCPEASLHVAIHARWHERYGARIACMSGDVIECEVERPPATRDDALALAREQFLYCPDIVDQGVGSVAALAATLVGNRVWYFWWD